MELPSQSTPLEFSGEIVAVKARIRLLRSYDQISHAYQGYTLVMKGEVGGARIESFKVGVGPAAHAKNGFRRGDKLTGRAVPVAHPTTEWADYYKTSKLKIVERGPESEVRPADPEGGIAPPIEVYRANGHRRLDARTCSTVCVACPFGLTMPTEITIDQWNPQTVKWRYETHCYGPKDCPRYKPGAPREVQGRKPDMVWIDDDVERAAGDAVEDEPDEL